MKRALSPACRLPGIRWLADYELMQGAMHALTFPGKHAHFFIVQVAKKEKSQLWNCADHGWCITYKVVLVQTKESAVLLMFTALNSPPFNFTLFVRKLQIDGWLACICFSSQISTFFFKPRSADQHDNVDLTLLIMLRVQSVANKIKDDVILHIWYRRDHATYAYKARERGRLTQQPPELN